MLKNFVYDGFYRDDNVSISVLLENPSEYGIEAAVLVFKVTFKSKNGSALSPKDFTFYIMDEANRMFNTRYMPHTEHIADEELTCQTNGLIITNFECHFLFQDLRIAFCYQPYSKINIIELKH